MKGIEQTDSILGESLHKEPVKHRDEVGMKTSITERVMNTLGNMDQIYNVNESSIVMRF